MTVTHNTVTDSDTLLYTATAVGVANIEAMLPSGLRVFVVQLRSGAVVQNATIIGTDSGSPAYATPALALQIGDEVHAAVAHGPVIVSVITNN